LVLGHLRRVFEERNGHAPEAEELTALLSLMKVREFEFDDSERDIEQAKTLIAQAVLAQPAQAGAAWGQIVGLMLSAASGQSGLRRASRPALGCRGPPDARRTELLGGCGVLARVRRKQRSD
jgi:hypothetical protein